jgi:hypothetical protein
MNILNAHVGLIVIAIFWQHHSITFPNDVVGVSRFDSGVL